MTNLTNEIKEKIRKYSEEPGRVFGLIYPFILTIIIILGFYYVSHLNDSARQRYNPALPDSTVQKDLTTVQAKVIPPVDLTKLGTPDPAMIEKGKSLFQSNCVSCHGEEGKGNGPASTGLNPPPRNFTTKTGWKNGPKLSQIFTTLQDGIPGSAMIAYEQLTPEEKFSIGEFIRATFVPDPPKDAPEDFATLDQLYNLSKGKDVPAQIPVLSAEKVYLQEKDSVIQTIIRKVGTLSGSMNNQGGDIFNKVVKNKFKAVSFLAQDDKWKGSEKDFINYITLNVNQNGFTGEVFNLSKDEVNSLYNFVKSVL